MDYKEKVIALLSNLSKEQKEKLENIFPELKESEDERIRKELCKAIWTYIPYENAQEYIAWLEKQYNDCPEAANIEPKFHEGEWITTTDEEGNVTTEKIIEFWGDKVRLIDINGVYSLWPKHELNYYHLWTIADAKVGDVLVDENNNIGLYSGEKDDLDLYWHSCIYLGCDGYFRGGFDIEGYHTYKNTKPATKEQRDLLFQKMKEAGYEWDATKKKLKEIKVKTLDPDKVIEWLNNNWWYTVCEPKVKALLIDKFKKDFGL